jgi:hypothetical protein
MTKTLLIVVLLFVTASARASDEPKYSDELTVLTLAQQCVGEIDFTSLPECWMMWHINLELTLARQKRDPDWHLVDQLKAYNSPFKVQTPRTLWVLELNLENTAPAHWDDKAGSWERIVPRWIAIVNLARRFLEDPGKKPCIANAYGGSCLNPKGACDRAPKCWVQVICHSSRHRPFAQAYYVAKRCSPIVAASR